MKVVAPESGVRSDEDLATRFTREAEPFFDVLSRGARRLTRNDADAEDLAQDTLMHAYAGFHTFREGSNFKAWLFRILHNRWVSAHRAKQCRPVEVSPEHITDRGLNDNAARLPGAGRSAECEVLDSLPEGDIEAAMATMPQSFREAIFYADVEGYTYAETAALLGIPIGTAMSRVSRGRKRLRMALADRMTEDTEAAEPRIA